jgi:hypothetical protein
MMKLLLEDLTLQQLMSSPISPSIKDYSQERFEVQGPTTKTSKFLETIYDSNQDIAIFKFLTEATEKYGPAHNYADTNPVSTPPFNLEGNPSKTYEVWIGFYPVKQKLVEILQGREPKKPDVKEALNQCFIRIWSNAPSFHWQGFNYNLSKQNAALFPTDIPPKKWDKLHGSTLLDKHTSQIVTSMPFYINQFAQALLSKIK